MIENIKYFWIALLLLIVSSAITVQFPHAVPFGETIMTALHFPPQPMNGLQYVGITSLILFIVSLFFLTRSLERYHKRAVFLWILVTIYVPALVVNSYQETFATGIYAVSYDRDSSICEFEMIGESNMDGECELVFENKSEEDVQFTVTFYDKHQYDDELLVLSLMNDKTPFVMSLQGKETKTVKLRKKIDVSDRENHVDWASTSSVHIIMKSDEKLRKL
ncbi:hypothetical protein SAMN05421503_2804 [Terribacillus aidingensis]|uniref:Uncharacterized protein n=1 Tax=Terribacillus aidingensis TaxID=586416 RepID=A0A285P446_9BACI|nr:hypothetical protein SAMN05421503_2804 [Terribacillus aidingensis]